MIKNEKNEIRKVQKGSQKIDDIYTKFCKILKSRNTNQRNILKQVQSQFLNQQVFDQKVMKYDHQNKNAEKGAYFKLKNKGSNENKKQETARKRLLENSTMNDNVLVEYNNYKLDHVKVEPIIGHHITKDFVHSIPYQNFINQIEKTSEFKYELQRLQASKITKTENLKLLKK